PRFPPPPAPPPPADPNSTIPAAPSAFKLLDLYQVQTSDLSFTAPFATTLARDIDALDGYLIWFDMFFSPTRDSAQSAVELASTAEAWAAADPQNRVAFTTGPHGRETHWKQGLLLCKPKAEEANNASTSKVGGEIKGEISFSIPEDHARGLIIKVAWNGNRSQTWSLR
ncbi:hypothetical protein PC116_g33130, partial [Phytophthora cactorum]